jgi:hypothetical protein
MVRRPKETHGQMASVDGKGPLGGAKVSIDDEDRLMRSLACKGQPKEGEVIGQDPGAEELPEETGELRRIDPQALGAQFLDHCLIKGWVVRRGSGQDSTFFVTEEGRAALAALFHIRP